MIFFSPTQTGNKYTPAKTIPPYSKTENNVLLKPILKLRLEDINDLRMLVFSYPILKIGCDKKAFSPVEKSSIRTKYDADDDFISITVAPAIRPTDSVTNAIMILF